MDSSQLAKWIVIIGLGLILIGSLIFVGSKLGIPFGKLPGDVSVKKENFSLYVPIVTSLILSVILTVVINVILYFFRK